MEGFYSRLIRAALDGAEFCGIIYCMYWIRAERIVPSVDTQNRPLIDS
jgi:hypothetical protein